MQVVIPGGRALTALEVEAAQSGPCTWNTMLTAEYERWAEVSQPAAAHIYLLIIFHALGSCAALCLGAGPHW